MKIKITSLFSSLYSDSYDIVRSRGNICTKKGYKLKNISENRQTEAVSAIETRPDTAAQEMVAGSFMVASQCPTCNSGYALDQIVFTGFDKNQNNAKESLLHNKQDRQGTHRSLAVYRIHHSRQTPVAQTFP